MLGLLTRSAKIGASGVQKQLKSLGDLLPNYLVHLRLEEGLIDFWQTKGVQRKVVRKKTPHLGENMKTEPLNVTLRDITRRSNNPSSSTVLLN